MTHTTIPAGYRLTVKSWENDADNSKTEILDGLSEEKTRFLVDLCKLHDRSDRKFGNMYDPSEKEMAKHDNALKEVVSKYPAIQQELTELLEECAERSYEGYQEESIQEFCFDFLYDLGLTGTEFHTRVCTDFVVEYIPNDIIIEDVTDKFV